MKVAIFSALIFACLCASGCAAKLHAGPEPKTPAPSATYGPRPEPTDRNNSGTPRYKTYEDYVEALTTWKVRKLTDPASPPVPALRPSTLRRFERVSDRDPADTSQLALDTVTGQLCRTWDWSFKNQSLNGAFDKLPLCVDIYRQFPSETP